MPRPVNFFISTFIVLCLCVSSIAQNDPANEEWAEIVIRGQTYYRMPDSVKRDWGYEFPDIPDDENSAIFILRAVDNFVDFEGPYEFANRLESEPWTENEFPEASA